ncbi:MAG: glyoxylate/hydroxypyruvate reductase A [Gammaproteobacteria bacterium]|nr:glyoxylate/hydroxypyruvate reductase A [Gammaproteobacteria bacterium]
MSILYSVKDDRNNCLLNAIKQALPEQTIVCWPDCPNPEQIEIAIVWGISEGFFEQFPNLTHLLSLSAGVDYLLNRNDIPDRVSIVRLHDAGMGARMAEYVLMGTLWAQRKMPELAIAQKKAQWMPSLSPALTAEFHVGLLGAGVLASKVAITLADVGYPVSTWSRQPKQIPGVTSYFGQSQRADFLANLDVLACLLPLTPSTAGILNATLFDELPKGAFLINAGRGAHLLEDDLIPALDSGQLSGALLDVFIHEPLTTDHPFWSHPRITITPHVAAETQAAESAAQIGRSLECIARGEDPPGLVDRTRGY